MKRLFVFCIAWLISAGISSLNGQPSVKLIENRSPTMQELMEVQETFVYNVKYGFLNLGKINVEIVRDSLFQGRKTYQLKTVIKSNASIPFMGQQENHYYSLFFYDDSLPRTAVFWKDDIDSDIYGETRYAYSRECDSVYTYMEGEPVDTLALEEPASSGHILFYLTRLFAGKDQRFKVPVYIDHEKGYLEAHSSPQQYEREYRAFKFPIQTFKMEGTANVNGPFGFSGAFNAWFSASKYRVPLEAHVKVWLGHVKVRLINYSLSHKNHE